MIRKMHCAAPMAALLTAFVLQSGYAQAPAGSRPRATVRPVVGQRAPARFARHPYARPIHYAGADEAAPSGEAAQQSAAPAHQFAAGYPQLGAPLYPAPRPNIPIQTGAAVITNQALAPHEMLYAHEYRAMYPPFYYKVKGGWIWTPAGMRSHDTWELQGTKVTVKYRSRYGLLSTFFPPYTN